MEHIPQPFPSDGRINYLPHHGVLKPDRTTTKLRVVFDASVLGTNGLSLNQTLLTGPKLQQDLTAILLKFRTGVVSITADVKQMFRQIWIVPNQRDYQRIIWRFSESDPISDYRLKTVTFGVVTSPYLAMRCLLQLSRENKDRYPLASSIVETSLYVDDIVAGVELVEKALELRTQLQELFAGTGFELRKWATSHPVVLDGLGADQCNESTLSFGCEEELRLKVLVLHWFSQSDEFGFRINPLDLVCSKCTILSELARIFDPLGFLIILTFKAKRMIQRLWSLRLDWDDRCPEICRQWDRYVRNI